MYARSADVFYHTYEGVRDVACVRQQSSSSSVIFSLSSLPLSLSLTLLMETSKPFFFILLMTFGKKIIKLFLNALTSLIPFLLCQEHSPNTNPLVSRSQQRRSHGRGQTEEEEIEVRRREQ